MTNWRKATIALCLSTIAIAIGYDILVVTHSENDTISNVTMTTIYSFPFLGYALCVLIGHFFSLIRTKQRYIWSLIGVSLPTLIISIITVIKGYTFHPATLAVFGLAGLVAGSLFWSMRRT
jgi:hypothetical protein